MFFVLPDCLLDAGVFPQAREEAAVAKCETLEKEKATLLAELTAVKSDLAAATYAF